MTAQHIMQIVAQNSWSPKIAVRLAREAGLEITKNAVREIYARRVARERNRLKIDPLVRAASTRAQRCASVVESQRLEREKREAADLKRSQIEAQIEADRIAREAKRAEVRASLILAARAARSFGYSVRSSTSRSGRVSSYYVTAGETKIRISDHFIPATAARDLAAYDRSGSFYDGFRGPELVLDQPRRYVWLRRAITLLANGRSVLSR